MSSTGRTEGLRSANDSYMTPGWTVDRLLESEHADGFTFLREGGKPAYWLDPCAGSGQIIQATTAHSERWGGGLHNVRWHSCEIEAHHEEALKRLCSTVVIGDFLHVVPARYDVVLTNPPYMLAEEFVRACVPIAERVAMLLRVNWAAAQRELLHEYPADMLILPDRPSFALNKHGKVGSDSTEYAWFVWRPEATARGYGIVDVLADTPVEVRSAYRRELFERLTKKETT